MLLTTRGFPRYLTSRRSMRKRLEIPCVRRDALGAEDVLAYSPTGIGSRKRLPNLYIARDGEVWEVLAKELE